MKDYVKSRGAWIDAALLNDRTIPETPKVTSCGPTGFAPDQLQFRASKYDGHNAFAAIKWRMAEIIKPAGDSNGGHPQEGPREITAVWESPELPDATQANFERGCENSSTATE